MSVNSTADRFLQWREHLHQLLILFKVLQPDAPLSAIADSSSNAVQSRYELPTFNVQRAHCTADFLAQHQARKFTTNFSLLSADSLAVIQGNKWLLGAIPLYGDHSDTFVMHAWFSLWTEPNNISPMEVTNGEEN